IVETSLFTQGTTSFSSIIFFDSDGIQGTRGRDELAYEMGRQWFYGLIGTDQINAPWLGEGASAMLSQYVFHSESDVEKIMNNNYNILKQSVYSNVVLSDNLDKYSTWEQYLAQKKKAALMFYNLKEKVGNDKFYEIIKKYSVAYSYKIATGENFCRIAEEVSGINLRQFFDEWISGQT
ncbi:MAG: hypothetical protein LBM16_01950, partial [Clostridiales bacterium]|nr:hypothetical protein [Clostridiales bacterium]